MRQVLQCASFLATTTTLKLQLITMSATGAKNAYQRFLLEAKRISRHVPMVCLMCGCKSMDLTEEKRPNRRGL